MKNHMRLLAIVMVAMMMIALAACGKTPTGDPTESGADTVAPVINVTGVPETCKVGDEVTVPAATATDDVDGDISANIKVTVSQLKEDGSVNRDLIYQKAGNVAQTFTAGSNKLLVYKISDNDYLVACQVKRVYKRRVGKVLSVARKDCRYGCVCLCNGKNCRGKTLFAEVRPGGGGV